MAIIKRKIENLKPGKEYIVTARAKNADVNVVSNYTDTIRFVVPVDTTIPQEVFNLKLYQSIENVMFVFDNVSDKDISTYEYELYSDISGTQLVSTGYNDASVFTVAVSNLQTDAQGEGLVPYWGRVRAIDTSGNMGAWTPLSKTDERVPLIDNQFIGSLTASKITAGSIGAHEIVLTQPGVQTTISTPPGNAVLRSSNYDGSYNAATQTWSEATSGWIITGDGRAEFNNAVIRGNFKSISLDVGTDPNSFHINNLGQVWAGSATFADARFSIAPNGTVKISRGSIDIGDGTKSFHVDDTGNMWMGSNDYGSYNNFSGTFRVDPQGSIVARGSMVVNGSFVCGDPLSVPGNTTRNPWPSPSGFAGGVNIKGSFVTEDTFFGNQMNGDVLIGYNYNQGYDPYPLFWLSTGSRGLDSYTAQNFGHTKLLLRRKKDFNIGGPSGYNNQIIQIMNESPPPNSIGNGTVAGIGFAVGRLDGSQGYSYGCVLRCFPGSGGSPTSPLSAREWISGLIDDPASTGYNVEASLTGFTGTAGGGQYAGMDGAGWNGLDVGNFNGDGYGYIGAASFVTRSSIVFKENTEYMPAESRSISIERIRKLKPARWDDKAKLSYYGPSEKFQKINKKWIEKGKTPLEPDERHMQTYEHDCAKDDCIGNEFKNCPQVEFQKKRYGFIAEDVAEVFPKAVQFSTFGNPIGIDYSVITYSLVETTQHLLDKIDQLEAKISELTAENNN